MDYNPRQSMARGNSVSTSNRRPPPEEVDPFILRDPDICENVTFLGVPFSLDDLRKPQPQQIQRLYEFLADLCMTVTRETVGPAMSAAASEIAGPDMADRLYSQDVRDLMGLFVRLRAFMVVCQVNDFGFADLFKPTYPRLQKILSYVINFVRFREGQTPTVQEFVEEKEKLALRVQQLVGGNEGLEARLHALKANRAEQEHANQKKKEAEARAKEQLIGLNHQKMKVMNDGERATAELKRLCQAYDERQALLEATSKEAAKLRPYTFQKPDALQTNLRELNATLAAEKAQIEAHERRERALQTSADSFSTAAQDVAASTRVLTELANDMLKEEEQQNKATRFREALSDKKNNVQEVEREEKLLQKKLDTINVRIDKLRRTAKEKADSASVRMNELKETQSKLQKERNEQSREVDKRRVRIEQTEKKMTDLKENIENEINSAREEYLKMESHVNLYITEMGQTIV
ncbi:hypothetical protein BT63DRAFT_422206 [Microthyrium microscopicum]|uniref:Probable kinetochore protein NUF2 n=1 Tax=Microthyrium microscopicum TaxID=703497 RepID=A0A6A6UJK9_9PEZI|nr:hypothetical protein BT63DRAFT_422206 [Microthyrium microscopicum]